MQDLVHPKRHDLPKPPFWDEWTIMEASEDAGSRALSGGRWRQAAQCIAPRCCEPVAHRQQQGLNGVIVRLGCLGVPKVQQ